MGKQQASADGAQGCIVSHARAFAPQASDELVVLFECPRLMAKLIGRLV
jgi:hypothetical protein